MKVNEYVNIISEQMKRALWEVKNVVDCIPEELWKKEYCEMPLWKHVSYDAFFGSMVHQSQRQSLSGTNYSCERFK